MVCGGRETVMCSMVVGLLVVDAGAVISARVPSQAATATAVNPVSATASRAERGRPPRARHRVLRTQRGPNPVDDRGVDLGCRRPVAAQRGDVTADPVQRVHGLLGIRIGADLVAQPSGSVVVVQPGLQVGEGIDGQRRVVALVVSHPRQSPSSLTQMPHANSSNGVDVNRQISLSSEKAEEYSVSRGELSGVDTRARRADA